MIRILVFSDTHRRSDLMREVIRRKRTAVDLVIHLGDNFADLKEVRDEFPTIAFLGVRGNCDWHSEEDFPEQNTICFEGHKIFFTHGHKLAVRGGDAVLTYTAKSTGADIALFGHTHVRVHRECDGVTVFNPGSLAEPRDGKPASFGYITIDNEHVTFEHLER